jgi:phospholipid transport system substrate-binding protein
MRISRMPTLPILVLLISWGVAAAAEEATDGPVIVIETRATALAEKLQGRQDYYSANSQELHGLVRNILLPGFDVDYASKLVLGRAHWTAASAAQRSAFNDAFYEFLVRTYSKGLIGFDQSDMSIEPQARYSKDNRKALVSTSLLLESGDSVGINYALRKTEAGWKMYDVRIDGVSYIQNYRSQFDAEISALGIDAVIERLEAESSEIASAAETA